MASKKPDLPGMNVQAYIRVRPLGSKEKKCNNLEFSKKEVILKGAQDVNSRSTRTLTYDRVFQEDVKQITVYNTIVRPLIKEVLKGYNCTVFAYGQTGTGKTYTMTGGEPNLQIPWENDIHAGMIPRALEDIFKELDAQKCEYQVSVTYIELYNEKLRSLLKDTDDNLNIQLVDTQQDGVVLKNLAPTLVKNRNDALTLLQDGAEKRQVACTFMNLNSSRSHTIFTINVKIKESTLNGQEDVVRVGKLHLVDLAGSENVSKSGASDLSHKTPLGVNRRLTEASNINRSLLTLGRVITSLTENNPHIPYRESKLTRFLQDSLGGKTKTCVIGTISPAQANMDETESTLNYAYKARSIKNKPEKNLTISKKEFMQNTAEEIARLKRDLEASRQADGYFISNETHEENEARLKELTNEIKDWNDRYKKLNEDYEQKKEILNSLTLDYDERCAELEEINNIYHADCKRFNESINALKKEKDFLEATIGLYQENEKCVVQHSNNYKAVINDVVEKSGLLHDKLDKKFNNENQNLENLKNFKTSTIQNLDKLEESINKCLDEEVHFNTRHLKFVTSVNDKLAEEKNEFNTELERFISQTKANVEETKKNYQHVSSLVHDDLRSVGDKMDEITSNSSNALSTFIHSVLIPRSQDISGQIQATKELGTNGLDILKKSSTSTQRLTDRSTALHEKLNEAATTIRANIDIFDNNMKEQLEATRRAKETAAIASEKAANYVKAALDLEAAVKASQVAAESAFESAQILSQGGKTIKAIVTDEIDNFESTSREEFHGVITEQEKRTIELKYLFNKLVNECEDQTTDNTVFYSEMKQTLLNMIECLQENNLVGQDKIHMLGNTVQGYQKELQTYTEKSQNDAVVHSNNMHAIMAKEDAFIVNLREEHSYINENLTSLKVQQRTVQDGFKSVQTEIDRLAFTTVVPSGSTPRRIKPSEIDYPPEFPLTDCSRLLQQFNKTVQPSSSTTTLGTSNNMNISKVPVISVTDYSTKTPTQANGFEANLRRSLSEPSAQKLGGREKLLAGSFDTICNTTYSMPDVNHTETTVRLTALNNKENDDSTFARKRKNTKKADNNKKLVKILSENNSVIKK